MKKNSKQNYLDAVNHLRILLENRDAYISQLEKNNEALITYAKKIKKARFASSVILDEQVKIKHLIK